MKTIQEKSRPISKEKKEGAVSKKIVKRGPILVALLKDGTARMFDEVSNRKEVIGIGRLANQP